MDARIVQESNRLVLTFITEKGKIVAKEKGLQNQNYLPLNNFDNLIHLLLVWELSVELL